MKPGCLALIFSKAIQKLGRPLILHVDQMIQFTLDEYRVRGLSTEAVFNQRCVPIDEYLNL
jgi:hypothetical protein